MTMPRRTPAQEAALQRRRDRSQAISKATDAMWDYKEAAALYFTALIAGTSNLSELELIARVAYECWQKQADEAEKWLNK